MALLKLEQLVEILSDLGPQFSALSDERRIALCNKLNAEFKIHQEIHEMRRDATPHKRMEKLLQIERAAEKVQELLRGFDVDMEGEIDRLRGHPRASRPPTQDEVLEELSVDPTRAAAMQVCRGANCIYPSRQAKEEVQQIKKSLSTLVAAAQSGIGYVHKQKDGKRKHDRYHDLLLAGLGSIYERTFEKKASARREGQWLIFLSRILSILEDKDTSPDAAYEAWLKVKKRLPPICDLSAFDLGKMETKPTLER